MTKRELKLMREIQDRYPCRFCGAFHYPRAWMTKTREKLVSEGVLEVVECAAVSEYDNIPVRPKA